MASLSLADSGGELPVHKDPTAELTEDAAELSPNPVGFKPCTGIRDSQAEALASRGHDELRGRELGRWASIIPRVKNPLRDDKLHSCGKVR
eukprot:CAMPEP_0115374544 /NCGR_PEP_ID=MMETSP0271-20121206/2007_1 /TAXON_ID=71861 /ORGANISM="Scrippsiella trochoidea, Strain CCMP3099" /LENGTH=90 /DNA_ID=CAMNT_0002797591 /DNA_START=574 /DNA_END=842 /DNA_ORIENTATION=-